MRVRLDVEHFWARDDPWGIGDADSARYKLYRGLVLEHAQGRSRMLDLGCGRGAFLAHFRDDFAELHGLELSEAAVRRGRHEYPFINFSQGSVSAPPAELSAGGDFDAIVFSDVVNYLKEREKHDCIAWIASNLSARGVALIAAWSPGGKYLTPGELRRIVSGHLSIMSEQVLSSGHALFVASARRSLVALTVDYETWQPVPEGRVIDWERDVFRPTAALFELSDKHHAPLTLMVELGEYMWLRDHDSATAERLERQLREAVRRGHDVQAHLHPNWLPELGARRDETGWHWDWSVPRLHDYPGDIADLLVRLKRHLESVVSSEAPRHQVVCFRAGTYEAQPFQRLHEAFLRSGLSCDSSVYAGGWRPDRGYDYTLAYSRHQPYYAARYDPQLRAPPAEEAIVELPIFAFKPGLRWTFDPEQGRSFASHLHTYGLRETRRGFPTSVRRRLDTIRGFIWVSYSRLRCGRRLLNRFLPRALLWAVVPRASARPLANRYFVLAGHSKTDLDMESIDQNLGVLSADPSIEFVTLSEMATLAERDLKGRAGHAEQIEDGSSGTAWREVLRGGLIDSMPLDRSSILAFPAQAAEALRARYPWAVVTATGGLEPWGRSSANDPVHVATVYIDAGLEALSDPDKTLRRIHRELGEGGVLVAALPSSARNPAWPAPGERWQTAPHDVRTRLETAGFVGVEVEEIDAYRQLGTPHPPSRDAVMVIRAWKRRRPVLAEERVEELLQWVYKRLDPGRAHESSAPLEILRGGSAWCSGYTLVLGEALLREGFGIEWVSMIAEGHPRGRGPSAEDSHEVLQVTLPGGRREVVDPTSGIRFPHSLPELLEDPELADFERPRDYRYRQRNYDLYATSEWYRRVGRVSVRRSPHDTFTYLPANRLLASRTDGRPQRRHGLLSSGERVDRPPWWPRIKWLLRRMAGRLG